MIINKEALLKYLSDSKGPLGIRQLYKHFSVYRRDRKKFIKFLEELEDNKIISTEFVRSTIIVKENLSYNEAENLVNNELN